jgi:hypothetical protein
MAQGYMMVYFDGVNRFYLAKEIFTPAPNIWDDFVNATQIVQQERIAALEAEIDRLRRSSHQRGSMSEQPT